MKRSTAGGVVPTLYAASTLEAALMETVFHDVPLSCSGHIHDLERDLLSDLCTSRIAITRPLQLVDLTTIGLRRIGLEVSQLIETEKDDYPRTRAWAAWFRDVAPEASGLRWMSRRDNSSQAIMLFGDVEGIEEDQAMRLVPLRQPPVIDAILDLMERLGLADAGP